MNFKRALKFSKKNKGFSLVEVLIATFIFTVIITMSSGSFVNFYKNYNASKKLQKDLEGAQYAMNLIGKTLRTSELITTNFPLRVFDRSHTNDNCILYTFASSDITISTATESDKTACENSTSMSTPIKLTSGGIIDAKVLAEQTTSTDLGKIVINLTVQSGSLSPVKIQTATSLRL